MTSLISFAAKARRLGKVCLGMTRPVLPAAQRTCVSQPLTNLRPRRCARLTFSPAIIWSGAFQNVAVASGVTDLDGKVVTPVGTDSTDYRQNMVFRKDAFALVSVPLVAPPGAVDVGRKTYKGTSVRVIPVYDGTNDTSAWRMDVLYGVKTIDPRQAVRLSGTS